MAPLWLGHRSSAFILVEEEVGYSFADVELAPCLRADERPLQKLDLQRGKEPQSSSDKQLQKVCDV